MAIPRGPAGSGALLSGAGADASARIAALGDRVDKFGKAVQPAMTALNGLATAGKVATASLTGLVYFGARGTAELNRLTWELQRAARELANSFAPAIRKLTDGIASLADTFHGMTGPQQAFVRNLTLGVIAAGGVSLAFLKVQAGLGALATSLAAARTAMAAYGVGGAGAYGFAAAGVIGLLSATKEGREALLHFATAFKPLLQAAGELLTVFAKGLVPVARVLAEVLHFFAHMIRELAEFLRKLVQGKGIAGERGMSDAQLQQEIDRLKAEKWRGGVGQLGIDILKEEQRRRRGEGSGEQKSALTLATAGGAEDPRAILQRLQVASNKADYQRQTAEKSGAILDVLKQTQKILDALLKSGERKEVAQ